MQIGFISLGCAKNQVDTEIMMGEVNQVHTLTSDLKQADIVIINTCGFITEAKEEAITTILETAGQLSADQLLLVTGCLAQRYAQDLLNEMPEIDGIMGVSNPRQISDLIASVVAGTRANLVAGPPANFMEEGPRVLSTPNGWGYLKIAEGCHNRCSYCAIPGIRGTLRCRRPESILEEAKSLALAGCKELVIVAQDTSAYRYNNYDLGNLLSELNQIEELQWLRLLYAHPRSLDEAIIEVIAGLNKVVPYLDLPIQHADNQILKRMNRNYTRDKLIKVITDLRRHIPDIVLRTTVMVGFPGETEKEYASLKEFIGEARFNWVGTFAYSQEEGTSSAELIDNIPPEMKQERQFEIERIQQTITRTWLHEWLGQKEPVLIEAPWRTGVKGRTKFQAPDIDGRVLIADASASKYGSIIPVRFKKLKGVDLIGEIEA